MDKQSTQKKQGLLKVRDAVEHLSFAQKIFTKVGSIIHPNHISALRLPLGVGAIALHSISQVAGASLYAVNTLLDWVDGATARASGKRTYEGAVLDPLVDKLVTSATLWYLVAQNMDHVMLVTSAAVATVVDWAGQRARGPFSEQIRDCVHAVGAPEECTQVDGEIRKVQANVWGKLKFLFQSALLTGFLIFPQHETMRDVAAAGLVVASSLAVAGAVRRTVGQKKE